LEYLESRCLLSTGTVTPSFGFGGFGGGGFSGGGVGGASPGAGATSPIVLGNATTPQGNVPSTIANYYNFPATTASNGGAGTTIAIIDAYDDPKIQADLSTFSTQFGLPYAGPGTANPTLTVLPEKGSSSLPQPDPTGGWELETALDVEWAHAMAPNANILLVEANSPSTTDLLNAVAVANANGPGNTSVTGTPVVAVSMSWGGSAPGNSAADDATYFSTPGITYFAAAGDSGPGSEWPASSPNVVAVGGTTISGSSSSSATETVWADSGGGPGTAQKPTYQSSYASSTYVSSPVASGGLGNSVLSGNTRGTPDVSYDANPNTGVAVLDTYAWTVSTGGFFRNRSTQTEVYDWVQIGGTSVGTPQWAAIAADADGLRIAPQGAGSSLSGASQFLPAIYAIGSSSGSYASDFTDVTSGTTVAVRSGRQTIQYSAGKGYDYVTGLGSPNAAGLITALSASSLPTFATVSVSGKAAVSQPVTTVALAPHDIVFFPVTTITTVTTSPGSPASFPTSSSSSTSTNSSAPTQTQASNSTTTVTVVVVTLPFAALLSPTESVVVLNAQNQLGLSTNSSPGFVHTLASSGTEAGVAASSLVATTASPVLPPQSLSRAPGFDRGSAPRFYQEQPRLVPLDFTTPALGWDFVSRSVPVQPLDLMAIAQQAAALGRVAVPGQAGEAAAIAPAVAPVPVEQQAPESTPAFDPVLAGAVITLTGALTLHTARANGRGRRWPTFWPGR
jgi:subtilase family serine protease